MMYQMHLYKQKQQKVVMKIDDKGAEHLILTNPRLYCKYIKMQHGVTVLSVELVKALYGQVKSALLFYKKCFKDLKSIGFILRAYDQCVANRMVQGKQQMVGWYMDGIKSSHVSNQVQNKFVDLLIDMYDKDMKGNIAGKLKKCTGKVLRYLGMVINFETKEEDTL